MLKDAAMTNIIYPFHLHIPQTDLDDLHDRLKRTRWPDPETVDDTSQGPPLAKVRALAEYWRDGYDWRRCESLLNGFGQHRTEIDGLGIHFLHIRSPEPDALPLRCCQTNEHKSPIGGDVSLSCSLS
jgi:epoxide hydrolase